MNDSRISMLACLLAGLSAGCLDALGHQEIVTERSDVQEMMRLEDDRIEDKSPTFDPSRTIVEQFGGPWGCQVTLNKSATVTKLDIVPFEDADAALKGKIFKGRTEALAAVSAISGADPIPSMEVVNGALKPFNDGLYAAVEIQAEIDKKALLEGLLARLGERLASAEAAIRAPLEEASVLVGAALILGGENPTLDPALRTRAEAEASAFRAKPEHARPIGFYTWTPDLERVFTRDRFLQNRGGSWSMGAFAAIALVLGQDPGLLAQYQRATALYAGLTNPYVSYTIEALIPYVPGPSALADVEAIGSAFAAANPPLNLCSGSFVAFVPASRSKETTYFEQQFCTGVPDGVNLLDIFIQAIRGGAVDLAPGTDSGWYDYQLSALETLLLPERGPESQHLLLTAGYKKKLIDTFKSLLIQTRETHVKQLATAGGASAGPPKPVDIYPLFPAEPFPTFYLRTARAYRFVQTFLEAAMGTDFLGGTARMIETGARAPTVLAAELEQRVGLLYGLYFLTADAVGMARSSGLLAEEMAEVDEAAAVAAARAWLESWRSDPDVARDPRVIVPVMNDNGIMTYWAVIGVKALIARAEFVPGHEPVVTPTSCWTGELVPHRYTLLVEDTAEVRLPASRPPPTRAELRAICDRHATKDEIVRALESL